MPKIEIEHECEACKGTGLYQGFAEHDGAAVVCNGCRGTGKAIFKMDYKEFTGRKKRHGVKRVFQANVGIGVGKAGGKYKLEDFGGISFKDWEKGKSFGPGTEMRAFVCPAWWYQTVDYDKKPDWKECRACGSFSNCSHFEKKAECWKRFDEEQKK